jgi:hypothetical protein
LDAVGLVITEGDKPRYKHYIDPEGKTLGDIWSDIAMTQNERVNFEGQKPEKLVRRIIESCTNPGDLVLDPFLGSGTTAIASLNLSRRCIGIELTGDTMMAATDRIKKQFPDFVFREIYGHPKDLASAKALSQKDPYLFQQWVTTVCFPGACGPKGADRGKDGRLNVAGFFEKPHVRRALISVKGGRANPSDVQALTAVVDQDQTAVMGIFVCFEEYMTEGIRNAARAAGTYSSGDPKDMSTYGKIQVVPVERFFERNVKLGGLHVPSFVYKDETIDNPRPKERFSQRDLFQEALDILCD